MDFLYSGRLLVLDFGHPMNHESVKTIKLSLQNALALAAFLPIYSKTLIFGISVMNSRFTLIQPSNLLRKNYKLSFKKLDNLDKNPMINDKVTVQDYKRLLNDSLKIAFHEFELKLKEMDGTEEEKEIFKKIKSLRVTIITKKTASLLAEIMIDVINKSLKGYFFDNPSLVKKFQIIQVLNEEEKIHSAPLQKTSDFIDWMFCPQTLHDLESIFKEWFLKPDVEHEKLRIILSKDGELIVKCDVDDYVLDSSLLLFGQTFELRKNFLYEPTVNQMRQTEKLCLTSNLEILNRIPLSGMCPTMIFGTPRRIYATQNHSITSNESLTNLRIFKELCRKLFQEEQGLLAKPNLKTNTNDVNCYFFLTSDGNSLLLNSVAPTELYLSKSPKFLKPRIQIDQSVSLLVENCVEKIELLEEYSPSRFSSGLYEYLKRYLNRPVKKSNFREISNKSKLTTQKKKLFLENSDCETGFLTLDSEINKKSIRSSEQKNDSEQSSGNIMRKKNPGKGIQPRKKRKVATELENTNVHPALLSSEILGECHDVYSPAFDFPELDGV